MIVVAGAYTCLTWLAVVSLLLALLLALVGAMMLIGFSLVIKFGHQGLGRRGNSDLLL